MNSTICCFLYNPKGALHSLRDARFPCVVPGGFLNIGLATAAPAGPDLLLWPWPVMFCGRQHIALCGDIKKLHISVWKPWKLLALLNI